MFIVFIQTLLIDSLQGENVIYGAAGKLCASAIPSRLSGFAISQRSVRYLRIHICLISAPLNCTLMLV